MLTGAQVFVHGEKYLQALYDGAPAGKNLWVDASVIAGSQLTNTILGLGDNTVLADDNGFVAGVLDIDAGQFDAVEALEYAQNIQRIKDTRRLQYPWQIFQWNDGMIREDFELIRLKKTSQPLPAGNQYCNEQNIFIEEGAEINFAVLNALAGPIYIGKNAVIMEGSLVRGPFAACRGAVVKMGATIYGATTLGPYCTAGGEIKNSVMQAFSNKSHNGYLGDAVIGRWCNLGAGTSNSNVKNTGSEVKMWCYQANKYMPVGAKGGVIMGDYTRTAINTSLNTGTVTGICCNIFEGGILPKHINSFSWGGGGDGRYRLEKALDDIDNWKKMKQHGLSGAEKEILKHIFDGGD
jgi:UDP-N-acetylglucosamine diphosphorylase/glucosamine-1-phosphate N-acetyltransferase